MQVTPKSRARLRLQDLAFVALFLAVMAVAGWLSTRYDLQADWTAGGRNTLSEASRTLLERIEGPVEVVAYVADVAPTRQAVEDLVARYRRHKDELTLRFVNPETAPGKSRELGIRPGGELLVSYGGRRERLPVGQADEQALTNALQRVVRGGERHVVFLTGHGERDPLGRANHDLGDWGKQLGDKGIEVQTLNLAATPRIPDNTAVLVIAGPQVDLLPGEVDTVRDYVTGGGNLLWLTDPGGLWGLDPVAEDLGLEVQEGMVVDPTAARLLMQLYGVSRAEFALGAQYARHPITRDFETLTLFPEATALDAHPEDGPGAGWRARVFLESTPESWLETGDLAGEVGFDPGEDLQGPLALGVAMEREVEDEDGTRTQRLVVMGDGDFLSNTYLGNVGNLDLGLSIVNWLAHDDRFIAIPVRTAPDKTLNLSETAMWTLSIGYLIVLPLLLVGTGVAVWWLRRKA
jgi:ABC-type uncharacterized transport system involved in gliding motility auxiliary subunit